MALTSISKSKKAQPSAAEDSSAFGQIAERFRRAGDLERAVSLCREGLQKSPDHISARVTLGWALLELGKFDEAREELEHVLRRRADNLAAIRALAELHDRAEQTLNLPMDGPGQWPPSADQIDEMAGGGVADHFRAASAEDSIDPNPADEAAYRSNPPAVVPPAELGLAMWSALPPTEPAEPAHLSIAPTSIAAEPKPVQAVDQSVSDADLAALLAEAESLEALVDAGDAPVAAFESVQAEVVVTHAPTPRAAAGRATALADIAFQAFEDVEEVGQDDEPALMLEAQPDLDVLTAFASPAPETAPPTPSPADLEFAGPTVFVEATSVAYAEPITDAEPTGPGFQLESQSTHELESFAATEQADVDLDAVQSAAVDVDAQPILRFDLEPIVELEPVVEAAAPAAQMSAPVAVEPQLVTPIAIVPAESVVESLVIASAQARIAEVVAMARTESGPNRPKTSVIALERFLHQVHARRRTMAESVA